MAPPGGSSTLYGVLYQLLASIHHAVRLRLLRRGQKVLGARLVVEPTGGGGDLRIELPEQRIVEQWKARTTGKPWSLQQIVEKVLPDLYQDSALSLPDDETTYVFATEGHPTEDARLFFERLRGPVPEGGPLTGLRRGDQKILRGVAKTVRKRRGLRSEPDSTTYPKLRRLLSRFEIRPGLKPEDLAGDIDHWLLPLVDLRDDVPDKRQQLCLMILSKAAHGEVVIVPEDLLREAGLRGVSLENEDELRRKIREGVQREVERRKYRRDRDVRTKPDWPEDKPVLILAGESGQGKTWQLARLAWDLAKEEDTDKILAVLLASRGDAAEDLQQAADLLWNQAWDHDQSKPLDRVAAHWREVRGNTGQPWLAVCVDGVQSIREARALIEDFDWERWGIRLALSASKETGIALARERPEQIHLRILRDFTLSELGAYLRQYGRASADLPSDVRETLRRPLLAGIYATIGSDPQWRPTREYELYEEYWRWLQGARDQPEHPEDLNRVKRLALTLLDEEPRYPWSLEQLEGTGITDEARRRLEQIGWWGWTGGETEVWHDRLLSWALAEAVTERGSAEELADWLRRDRRPANPKIWRILAYLPLDVLWLLSGKPANKRLVTNLIVLKEEEDQPFGLHGLYEADLPSLGRRIVPSLLERLRRLPNRVSDSYLSLAENALSKILDQEPDGRADLPLLLKDASRVVREVAVGTLARHPHPDAIDLLWDRLRSSSRSIDGRQGMEALTTYQKTFPALRACLDLGPDWLKAKILGADPEEEPIWELAYLLANLKSPRAHSIWLEVKSELFRKMPLHKLRSLATCIGVFLDTEEAPRLESWLSVEEDWADRKAFWALACVAPDRAVQLLATLPLENLSDHHFGSWLPVLLLKRPEQTRRALRDRMAASGPNFWQAADLYHWYEERMDSETAELLLDRLSSEATWESLRRPLDVLSRIHRLGLLQAFEQRAGMALDRRLGGLGASWVDSPDKPDLQELRAVLLKIGGEGIHHLIRSGLASADPRRQRDGLVWARMFPEEIAAASPRDLGARALLGENRALVEEVIALNPDNFWLPDWWKDLLRSLWRLRRGKPPMMDEDLALAFEALGSGDVDKRMRGLEAISISGRPDLLSRLPEWLEGLGDLEEKKCRELDQRAAYLVHRLAGEAPEIVRSLTQALDFGRFPSLLDHLYGKAGAEALPDRLEQHLLSSLQSGRFGAVEMDFALTLSSSRELAPSLLREVWNYGRDDHSWNRLIFWKSVARLDSDEVLEQLWKRSLDRDPIEDERSEAVSMLATLEPEDAFNITARHLSETGPGRGDFASLLLELNTGRAIPLLIEQTVRERQTEVLWTIARILRRVGPTVELELRARLESPDFRVRKAVVHLAGWQGPGFLEADLQRMAAEDPDDDIQWECLQALDRQNKEHCVLELMDAFRSADGTTRWSYIESILALGDPRLLVTEGDPLWLGPLFTHDHGALEVHANWRLKERFAEVKRSAERRDHNQNN